MNVKAILLNAALAMGLATTAWGPAKADKLDDIIASGKLRCAVTLDFPPMGFRDNNNKPEGFDVDTCEDLAKALGVRLVIVDTPFVDRIPALVTGRADVGIASTSDTLQRAKTVGFSIPYMVFHTAVVYRKGTGISSYDSLKGHRVGTVAGLYEAIHLEQSVKQWGDPKGAFRAFQNQTDVWLAVSDGQIDATVLADMGAYEAVKSGKYPNLAIGGFCPYTPDYVGIIALRQEYGLLNYLNLFVNQQVRTGRDQELWEKWIKARYPWVPNKFPDVMVPGVYR